MVVNIFKKYLSLNNKFTLKFEFIVILSLKISSNFNQLIII
jgi:hypothetical protein